LVSRKAHAVKVDLGLRNAACERAGFESTDLMRGND
jgi:hypothetical protein